MLDQVEEFSKRLGLLFQDSSLLKKALTHKSYANEAKEETPHNETLEFLGDAILELVVSDFLFQKLPEKSEGDLSKLRASLVNSASLSAVARDLEVGDFLFLGKGELRTGGQKKDRILANTVEALIAAIYLDRGIEEARRFIHERILGRVDWENLENSELSLFDPKTKLQEFTQTTFKKAPKYRLLSAEGPDHEKEFEVELTVGEEIMVKATGRSKKEAEQNAAKIAIEARFS